jgi:Domain of unknown function (DUF305)
VGSLDAVLGRYAHGRQDDVREGHDSAWLSGKAFDKAFLQMMIPHHQGGITIAKTEQAEGSNGDAKALADSIVTHQAAEITTMQNLLQTLAPMPGWRASAPLTRLLPRRHRQHLFTMERTLLCWHADLVERRCIYPNAMSLLTSK